MSAIAALLHDTSLNIVAITETSILIALDTLSIILFAPLQATKLKTLCVPESYMFPVPAGFPCLAVYHTLRVPLGQIKGLLGSKWQV